MGKCLKTLHCERYLLIEWAGERVGNEGSVCHPVDVLHQVIEVVPVGAGNQNVAVFGHEMACLEKFIFF